MRRRSLAAAGEPAARRAGRGARSAAAAAAKLLLSESPPFAPLRLFSWARAAHCCSRPWRGLLGGALGAWGAPRRLSPRAGAGWLRRRQSARLRQAPRFAPRRAFEAGAAGRRSSLLARREEGAPGQLAAPPSLLWLALLLRALAARSARQASHFGSPGRWLGASGLALLGRRW